MQPTAKKTLFLDGLFIFLGSVLTACGIAVFTVPNHIAPGGVSGLATALSHLTGLPVGMLSLCMNIPLLLIAWKRMGFAPLVKTLIATITVSICIDVFISILPAYSNNALLAALTGGVFLGVGIGLLLLRGISTGGTDLVGLMLFQSKPILTMGQLLMVIDSLVVLIAVVVFRDMEVALYSIVTLFVSSKCIDVIQQGVDHAKVVYIVTTKADTLLSKLAGEMGRGVTVLPARGGFTNEEKAVLMTIARRNEVSATLQVIRMLDPSAFTILCDATEVHGEGFKTVE